MFLNSATKSPKLKDAFFAHILMRLRLPFVALVATLALSGAVAAQAPAQHEDPGKGINVRVGDVPKGFVPDGPPMLDHPHKVFVDAPNNKLYWPMDKPFWVRLAVSPDADAPSYLLQRVTPDSEISTEKYDKQGIELEIQNGQFIRWYNYVTKQNTNLEFYSDGDPPITKATCSGAPTYVDGLKTFYGVGLHCALASEDDLSGVETTYQSLDGAPYAAYAKDLVFDREKPVVFRYYAVDRVGYAEKPQALKFIVDLTAPTTTHAIAGNAIGTVLSTQAKFTIASTDALSGVSIVRARFDKQEFAPVKDGQVTVESLPDGDHTLSYYAVDRVDNRETEHVVPFYVDRIPPTVGADVVGDLFVAPGGTRYVSSRSQIKLSAQDNKIGLDKIEYSLDAAAFQPYGDLFLLPAHAGPAKLSYRASDKLGNMSAVATLPYTMDLAPPESTYHITGPMYHERTDFYITSASHVELTSTDDLSGVQKIEYMSEDAPQPQTYSSILAFPKEGRRLLRYWGTDRVNNRELERGLALVTDNTPPDIFANFSLTSTPTTDAQGLPVYRRLTSLFLAATDNASGVRKIYYSFNGGKETDYSTPIVLDHDGTFDLLIRAEDNLGNQSTKHVRFAVHN